MAQGGSKFIQAFTGDWFDLHEAVTESIRFKSGVDEKGNKRRRRRRKQKTSYREQKITSSEDIARSSTAGPSSSQIFNSRVLKATSIVESTGMDHWWDKRLMQATIDFSLSGVATVTTTFQEQDEEWEYEDWVLEKNPQKTG